MCACVCFFVCLFCGFLYYNTLRLNKGLGNTLDTQRVGDQNVTPMAVLSLIECELINADVHNSDAIDGSLVTTPIPGGRTKLGALLLQLMVQHGFVGERKWQSASLAAGQSDGGMYAKLASTWHEQRHSLRLYMCSKCLRCRSLCGKQWQTW